MGKNKGLRAQETIILLDTQAPEQTEVNLPMSCKRLERLRTTGNAGNPVASERGSRWWMAQRCFLSCFFGSALLGWRTGVIKTNWTGMKINFLISITSCVSFPEILWETREILSKSAPWLLRLCSALSCWKSIKFFSKRFIKTFKCTFHNVKWN